MSAPQLMPLLPLIAVPFGLELPDTPETAPLADEFRKARLEEATRELLGMLLLEPTVLVFEDTHWMDDASADLLRELIKGLEQRPWLVIAARRDQPTGFAAPEGSEPVVIELQPLGAAQAAALAHAATEETPLLPHEIEALTERAGGNPLFLTELMAVARQAGGIDRAAGLGREPDDVEDRPSSPRPTAAFFAAPRLSEPASRGISSMLRSRPSLPRRTCGSASATSSSRRTGTCASATPWSVTLPTKASRTAGVARYTVALAGRSRSERASTPRTRPSCFHCTSSHANEYDKAWRYSRIAGERAAGIYANMEAAAFFERALAAARRRRDVAADDRAKSAGDTRRRPYPARRVREGRACLQSLPRTTGIPPL